MNDYLNGTWYTDGDSTAYHFQKQGGTMNKPDWWPENQMNKPDWWPRNPYPESIFPLSTKALPDLIPDEKTRTSVTGCLARVFWNLASDEIFKRYEESREVE